jgi:hypothetical protein
MKTAIVVLTIPLALVLALALASVGLGQARPHLDTEVRADFFAGFDGDRARLARAMQVADDTLARDPGNAEALVWRGAGFLVRAREAFRAGDLARAQALSERGFKELDDAVALAPADPFVVIPRAATLHGVARAIGDETQRRVLLEKALAGYETALEVLKEPWPRLSAHGRGELLSGLVEASTSLGESTKAGAYRERLVAELPGSPFIASPRGCDTCHE